MSIGLAALLTGCATKPQLPPGARPHVEVGPPLKSDAWRAVATQADRDRLERLGLAWADALADANKTNAADERKESKLLLPRSAPPRPDPTPGSHNCRLIKPRQAAARRQP